MTLFEAFIFGIALGDETARSHVLKTDPKFWTNGAADWVRAMQGLNIRNGNDPVSLRNLCYRDFCIELGDKETVKEAAMKRLDDLVKFNQNWKQLVRSEDRR
jgi:hypothetical protein